MDEKKELTITFSPQVEARMAADPKLAAAMREMMANMRQAHHDVQAGKYPTFDIAMEAITGSRPEKVGRCDRDGNLIDDDDPE